MEKFLANTKRQPCTVNVHLDTGGATVPIYIVGYDTINPFTLYFRSRFQISGEDTVNLNCPSHPSGLAYLFGARVMFLLILSVLMLLRWMRKRAMIRQFSLLKSSHAGQVSCVPVHILPTMYHLKYNTLEIYILMTGKFTRRRRVFTKICL